MSLHTPSNKKYIIDMQTHARNITTLTIKLSQALGAGNLTAVEDVSIKLAHETNELRKAVETTIQIMPSTNEMDKDLVSLGAGGIH